MIDGPAAGARRPGDRAPGPPAHRRPGDSRAACGQADAALR